MDHKKQYRIRKSHPSKRGESQKPFHPSRGSYGKQGIITIASRQGMIHLKLNLVLRSRSIWFLLILSALILLLLASSLNERIRGLVVDILLGILQILIFNESTPKS